MYTNTPPTLDRIIDSVKWKNGSVNKGEPKEMKLGK